MGLDEKQTLMANISKEQKKMRDLERNYPGKKQSVLDKI